MIANHSKDIVHLVGVSYWLVKLEAHVLQFSAPRTSNPEK